MINNGYTVNHKLKFDRNSIQTPSQKRTRASKINFSKVSISYKVGQVW